MDLSDNLDDIADQLDPSAEIDFYDYSDDFAKDWNSDNEDFWLEEDSAATDALEDVLQRVEMRSTVMWSGNGLQTTAFRRENGRMWENTCKQIEYLAVRNAKLAAEYATLQLRLRSAQTDLTNSHQLTQQLLSDLHFKSLESASLSVEVQRLQGELRQLHGESAYWMQAGECVVCMCNMRAILLMPCLHLCVCEQCSEEIRVCPLCRQPVLSCLKPFA
jgi:hypothetical protein